MISASCRVVVIGAAVPFYGSAPSTDGIARIACPVLALYGQQDIGAPCPGPKSAAQSPDGRPMVCLGAQGWQPGTLTGAGFFPG